MLFPSAAVKQEQPKGAIRGVVREKEFAAPIGAAQVTAIENGRKAETSEEGSFVLDDMPPGKYTLVVSKGGYAQQLKSDVIVTAGQLTEVDVVLASEITEMDEFVAQDLFKVAAGSEASLLKVRFDSAALMDSIGAELMSRAGASDAAAALRLVAGASIQDNKSAVIRGLPDRYISSQLNGVRLPTADADKRAVQLDQFPTPVIESIQVSKTFTPDQQGDASGGAVNVKLKSIPDEGVFQLRAQYTHNNQVSGRDDFLSYKGGGVSHWGYRDDEPQVDKIGQSWDGAAGTSTIDAPRDYKWSLLAGGKHALGDDWKIGGLASFYYEHFSSFYDNGQDNSYWVEHPGGPMVPQKKQVNGDDFKTALFDVTQGRQGVRWGALGTIGLESENNRIGLTYLFSHTAEDVATLAEDTRGKSYFFPGYNVRDPSDPGNAAGNNSKLNVAPWLRLDTLEYTERTTKSLQFNGNHKLPFGEFQLGDVFHFQPAELDWTAAWSSAGLDQPDKRQFGALWHPRGLDPGIPIFGIPPSFTPPVWNQLLPADNVNLGNFQRIWKEISEDSSSYGVNLKFPFEQWSQAPGYLKTGFFTDQVDRKFNQETFANFGDVNTTFNGSWFDPWSSEFPSQDHPISASSFDVDYKGEQTIRAFYGMVDMPIVRSLDVIGGARFESTDISIVNFPESSALWFPPGIDQAVTLHPGEADVDFHQEDVLPSIGLVYKPLEPLTLRGSFSQTVARQTFKELTPILQQEFAGGPVFVGNPELQMANLDNYDVRVDCVPSDGALLSASWFYKTVKDPIEYVQRFVDFTFTTAENYPSGKLHGYEVEARESLGSLWKPLEGFAVGANATFLKSQVTLPQGEEDLLESVGVSMPTRDMTNAPDHLYNAYVTYDLLSWGSQVALFYTVQGDTLIAGATKTQGNFIPNVYAKQFDTLNFSFTQKFLKYFALNLQAKNLTNPEIETVYRSPYIGSDVLKTTFTRGLELSVAIGATFSF
jgi:outer membrane receptor protein involved in Fe transport